MDFPGGLTYLWLANGPYLPARIYLRTRTLEDHPWFVCSLPWFLCLRRHPSLRLVFDDHQNPHMVIVYLFLVVLLWQ